MNHVIAEANVTSAMVVEAGCLEVESAGGLMLGVKYDAATETATVNGVTISDFDVGGAYGILHGIDDVLLGDFVPCPTVVEQVAMTGNYNTLLGALDNPTLQQTLESVGPISEFMTFLS